MTAAHFARIAKRKQAEYEMTEPGKPGLVEAPVS
jgi:hypothetical protein